MNQAGGFLEPFQAVGITPPRGRQGHSVPTPRPLQGSKLVVHVAGRVEDRGELLPPPPSLEPPHLPSFPPKATQFSMRRDHSLGGSVSRLDRIRARHQDLPRQMESFAELEEEGGGEGEIDYFPHHNDCSDWTHPSPFVTTPTSRTHPYVGDTLDKFTGDSLLHFSFNAGGNLTSSNEPQLGGSFLRAFTNQGLHTSLNVPSLHQQQASTGDASMLFPSAAQNPNKAIVTIDAQTSRIVMTNEITCELFGYQRGQLVGMKVQSLFTEPYRAKQHALVERNIDSSGQEVLVSGKVLDAVTSYGVEFPLSVWMKKVHVAGESQRVIVVMEPVERTSACFSLDHQGLVISCDPWFASLFGYPNTSSLMGHSIFSLIPSLSLPHSLEELAQMPGKQAVTGRTKDSTAFPLTVQFTNLSQDLSLGDLYSPSHDAVSPTPTSSTHTTCSVEVGEREENPPRNATSPTAAHHTERDNEVVNSEPSATLTSHEYSTHPLALGETPINLNTISPADPVTVTNGEVPSTTGILNDIIAVNGEIPMKSPSDYIINAKVIVYASLGGMVSFLPDGAIHGCNHHFSLMLFGYSQEELLKKDITFLMPDFYNHIGYVDDRGMPLPPLDEEGDEISFHSTVERSFSPDSTFDYHKGRGVKGHVPPSPIKRKSHEVQRSPAKKSLDYKSTPHNIGHSPFHRPLNPPDPTGNADRMVSEGGKTSPKHHFPSSSTSSKGVLDKIPHGSPTMPTLVEEEEKEKREKLQRPNDHSPELGCDVADDVSMQTISSADTPKKSGQFHEKDEDEELQSESEKKEGEDAANGGPISSTPASKLSDSLSHVQKSESFPELLGTGSDIDCCSVTSMASLPEGLFEGFIRHKDGSSLAVVFQLKCVPLADGQFVFCVWVCRDLDRDRARNADLNMSTSRPLADPYWTEQMVSPEVSTEETDGQRISTNPQPPTVDSEEAIAMGGVYMTCYDTLHSVGNGAFGFVRQAQRKSDGKMVVVKFLRKSGVLKGSWVKDDDMGLVALEISLLARLSHPNIVMLLEAYENEHYFQLVMEKHGDSLDLFEFIEKSPKLTEPLVSYMFRQVVAGLAYLHDNSILHRDVKDENIIVDCRFHIKLIDFGSAAYMEPGKLFHTFCGTLEYCSPEVLLGNSYPGPELEMWALGVTLYTLVFGENPFFDVEETISGHLQTPFLTSPGLMKVIFWLLHPHPKSRATIQDLQKNRWINQTVDISQYSFEAIVGGTHQTEDNVAPPHISGVGERVQQARQKTSEKIEDLFDEKLHLSSTARRDE